MSNAPFRPFETTLPRDEALRELRAATAGAEDGENYEQLTQALLEVVHAEDAEDGGKRGENAYLRHLTYEGAKQRYDTITEEIRERLDFELETIERTGYPGYFLIVQDFTTEARRFTVLVECDAANRLPVRVDSDKAVKRRP